MSAALRGSAVAAMANAPDPAKAALRTATRSPQLWRHASLAREGAGDFPVLFKPYRTDALASAIETALSAIPHG